MSEPKPQTLVVILAPFDTLKEQEHPEGEPTEQDRFLQEGMRLLQEGIPNVGPIAFEDFDPSAVEHGKLTVVTVKPNTWTTCEEFRTKIAPLAAANDVLVLIAGPEERKAGMGAQLVYELTQSMGLFPHHHDPKELADRIMGMMSQ
ncbi:hypothetical protein JNK13_05065 [bacterium]|nr:hypothetical protein [bacterium]